MRTNVTKQQRICERCDQPFTPNSNSSKWCEACCTYTCEWCNTVFVSRKNRIIRFCCLDCTNKWQDSAKAKEQARHRTTTIRGRGKIIRCKTCDEPFYVPGWRLDRFTVRYCSLACRDYRADASHGHFGKVLENVSNGNPTKLEIAGRNLLLCLPTTFEEQQVIGGKFVVDVLIPDIRLVIQWDGDFWHAHPAKFQSLNAIQQENRNRDKRCDAYLAKCGYRVLRFWECDVHERPSWVSSEIEHALASSENT